MASYKTGAKISEADLPAEIQDGFMVKLNEESFDIMGFLHNPTDTEIREIKNGKLTLALFQAEDIPFLIGIFKGLFFDVSINAFGNEPDIFLNWDTQKETYPIRIILVDRSKMKIMAVRRLRINFLDRAKEVLINQKKNYQSPKEVQKKISDLQFSRDFLDMFRDSETRQSFS